MKGNKSTGKSNSNAVKQLPMWRYNVCTSTSNRTSMHAFIHYLLAPHHTTPHPTNTLRSITKRDTTHQTFNLAHTSHPNTTTPRNSEQYIRFPTTMLPFPNVTTPQRQRVMASSSSPAWTPTDLQSSSYKLAPRFSSPLGNCNSPLRQPSKARNGSNTPQTTNQTPILSFREHKAQRRAKTFASRAGNLNVEAPATVVHRSRAEEHADFNPTFIETHSSFMGTTNTSNITLDFGEDGIVFDFEEETIDIIHNNHSNSNNDDSDDFRLVDDIIGPNAIDWNDKENAHTSTGARGDACLVSAASSSSSASSTATQVCENDEPMNKQRTKLAGTQSGNKRQSTHYNGPPKKRRGKPQVSRAVAIALDGLIDDDFNSKAKTKRTSKRMSKLKLKRKSVTKKELFSNDENVSASSNSHKQQHRTSKTKSKAHSESRVSRTTQSPGDATKAKQKSSSFFHTVDRESMQKLTQQARLQGYVSDSFPITHQYWQGKEALLEPLADDCVENNQPLLDSSYHARVRSLIEELSTPTATETERMNATKFFAEESQKIDTRILPDEWEHRCKPILDDVDDVVVALSCNDPDEEDHFVPVLMHVLHLVHRNHTQRCRAVCGCNSKIASAGACLKHGGGRRCRAPNCGAGARAGLHVCKFHAKYGMDVENR